MRVIAGFYRRRTLQTPKGTDITRPTSDRVKESLFNIIAPEIEDASVLDLFAGSGSLGIEAISRGAKHVIFVEKNKLALASIQHNLEALNIPTNRYMVVGHNVNDFLAHSRKIKEKFNIIFADPPYETNWWPEAAQILENSGYCDDQCLCVLERPVKHKSHHSLPIGHCVQNWTLQDVRKYGKTQLEFWRRNYDQTIVGTT